MDQTRIAAPAAPLRGLVAAYDGYRQRGLAPASHRGLPSPYLTVIFTFDVPLVVLEHPDPAQPPATFDALVGGLHTCPARIVHDGAQAGVQVRMSPLGARALLGMPAAALAGADVHGAEVLGDLAARVCERLTSAGSWSERFAQVDAALLEQLTRTQVGARRAGPTPALDWAWRAVVGSGGRARVGELADRVGWSERHLTGRFRAEYGLTPKTALRLARFDRARRRIGAHARDGAAGERASLARVAASTGYADQSHLAREFRHFAGVAPSRWVAEEFGNVQATPARRG
ncbi:MAG: AraC family transcriptional regulator [Dermatophilaceae bacterium]